MTTNCNIKKHKAIKLVLITTILTLLSYVFLGTIKGALYATQTREGYSETKISAYSGYKELINKLKNDHPNWNFTIFYTGLDWNQVIKNETTAYHGRNVVPANWAEAWRCTSCGNTPRAGTNWRCASEAAVAYYMDPRNWLNDNYIFEFENLAYNPQTQTLEGVQKILSDVKYMQGENITYTKTDGTQGVLEKSYAQVIMEAAQEAKISPYHLASRIRQEQGAGLNPGALATGTCSGYVGYYNFLNIKASGNSDSQIIANGMNYAKNSSWTNPEISIKAGAKELASKYINDGQDTLYLQKFDVDSSDGTLYYFQYMQNVAAATSESTKVRSAYENMGVLNGSFEFIIPVYENMPETVCEEPKDVSIVTQNVKVTGNNVAVRTEASQNSTQIATLNTNDTVLRIEIAANKFDNYYWDKVVLANGQKGYMARDFITQIEDITNCNDSVVANTVVNLRNGPGTNGTTVIATLTKGQLLTRIETGKYNLDGYIWDRVKLSDGRQGYIAQNYIEISGTSSGTITTEILKIICESGLKVRSAPGTDKEIITYVEKNETVTRIEASVSNVAGYTWDKIITTNGIEGYIARGNAKEQYVEVIQEEKVEEPKPQALTTSNEILKIENNYLICVPEATVEMIKDKFSNEAISVKKGDGTEIESGNVGTGDKIIISDKDYIIVKLGDINGDGNINTGDTFLMKQVIMEIKQLNTDETKKSADINGDGEINTGDSFILKKHIMGVSNITL